jgi:hypothetical protein
MPIRNLCPQGGSRLAGHSGFSRAFWVARGEKQQKQIAILAFYGLLLPIFNSIYLKNYNLTQLKIGEKERRKRCSIACILFGKGLYSG